MLQVYVTTFLNVLQYFIFRNYIHHHFMYTPYKAEI